jgi:adenine-specific DNA methylase
MEIESGYNTEQVIRERGWTHWNHLFNARQLLTSSKLITAIRMADSKVLKV